MSHKTQLLMIGLICLALMAASCRRLPFAPPTAVPSITPTPRSTPLPPVPTPIPLGSADNPLHMKFVALAVSDSAISATPDAAPDTLPSATSDATTPEASTSTITDLEQALHDETQMTIDVEVVSTDAEALAALCASPKGTVSIAWLSGLAYAAAYAQGCGTALLQVERGTGASATTGDQARIIVNSALNLTGLGDLKSHTFCRLGYADALSWLIPSIMLQASGLATTDLKAIRDYTDASTMIDDVASGTCDAAGISGSQFDQIADSSVRSKVRTLQQSITIPYAVLVVPPEVPFGQQTQISAALTSLGSGTRAALLAPYLAQDQLAAASDTALATLRSFISRAGIDLSQVGS